MKWRVIGDLILATAFLFLPWWAGVLLGLAAVLYFRFYFEFVLACFFIDAVFGGADDFFGGIPYALTALAILVLSLSAFLRKRLAVYDSS